MNSARHRRRFGSRPDLDLTNPLERSTAIRERVRTLAKTGRLHPDPLIARASLRWAQMTWNPWALLLTPLHLVMVAVLACLGDSTAGSDLIAAYRDMRTARRILRIARHERPRPTANC